MRPAMAQHEPTQAGKDSVRGPAQAIVCCARGIRYVRYLCRLGTDAHWLAPETSITDRSNGDRRSSCDSRDCGPLRESSPNFPPNTDAPSSPSSLLVQAVHQVIAACM